MEKIVVEVGQYGRLVFGSVLKMPESLRGHYRNPPFVRIADGFEVTSWDKPHLWADSLALRGNVRAWDDEPFYHCFNTPEEATRCVQQVHAVVKLANEKLAALREMEVVENATTPTVTVTLQVVS